jgi:hypothetical protein
MPEEIMLTYTDGGGEPRRVPVRRPHFLIGRGAENDLVIDNANLSRRHALVELLDGKPYISDCGSSNGTTINGHPVTSAVELYSGDLIHLGNAVALSVSISNEPRTEIIEPVRAAGAAQAPAAHPGGGDPAAVPQPAPAQSGAAGTRLKAPFIAGAAIGLIVLGTAVLVFVFLSSDEEKKSPTPRASLAARPGARSPDEDGPGGLAIKTVESPGSTTDTKAAQEGTASPAASADATARPDAAAPPTSGAQEPIGKAVKRVMSRISTDDSPYISEAGVADVAAQVREYRGSASLAGRLRAAARACPELTSLARSNNLKPALLSYAALAESEGGGDPLSAARQMAPKLLTLRATFGTETANSTLLLVAAYPYPFDPDIGTQARTPHPLASKLMELGGRKSVVETSVARSVWFLREKNGITPEAYSLVVRLLAVGVIAQNPRQYGVDADPVYC